MNGPVIMNALKKKVHEKYCVIMFVEMSLRKCLDYNDGIETADDIGTCERENSDVHLATYVLASLIKGLNQNWKQVFV